jgi:hypothetical protein
MLLLPGAGGGDIVRTDMEIVVMRRGGGSKSPARCVRMTQVTANSAGSPLVFVRSSCFGRNPVKYTDPDGEFPILPILIVGGVAALFVRSDTSRLPPVDRNIIFKGTIDNFNTYSEAVSGPSFTAINPKISTEILKLYSTPVTALGGAMPRGSPDPNNYDDGKNSVIGATINTIDLAGGILEHLTDGNGNMLGDIRLQRTKVNGVTSWSIIETSLNHISGELKGNIYTKEQALLFLTTNKENFTDDQYREIARLLDID